MLNQEIGKSPYFPPSMLIKDVGIDKTNIEKRAVIVFVLLFRKKKMQAFAIKTNIKARLTLNRYNNTIAVSIIIKFILLNLAINLINVF